MWIVEKKADSMQFVGGASGKNLEAWVERVAVPRHRLAERGENVQIRRALAKHFDDAGFEVTVQGAFENVVALPPRVGPISIVAAHFDSVPRSPGADDNASGVAVMMEVARLLADRAVGFVAFNAEEDGLLGSQDFVTNALPGIRHRIEAVHVLEMVGYRSSEPASLPMPWQPPSTRIGDFIALLGNDDSNAMVDAVIDARHPMQTRVIGAKTWGPIHRLLPDLTRSDHFPFWTAGMRAMLWTDTGNFRNPHYHRTTDTPETLDYAFMRDVANALTSTLRRQA